MSHPSAPALAPGDWFAPNHRALCAFLAAPHSPNACAALDWDNTSCRGDIGETVFRYQLAHGVLRLTPEALAALLRTLGGPSDPTVAQLIDEVVGAWRIVRADDAVMPLTLAAERRLRVCALLLYEHCTHHAHNSSSVAKAYGLLAQLWSGYSATEIEAHAAKAIAWGESLGTEPITWRCEHDALGPQREVVFVPTLGIEPHMRALYAALGAHGIAPYVITASFEPLVRAAARVFDVQVAPERIIGLRLAHEGSETQAAPLAAAHPLTYRAGKAEAVARYLPSAPVFCAGDALTDYELLTYAPPCALRLLVDRNSAAPELQALYREALEHSAQGNLAGPSPASVTLLQARDPITFAFVPQQRSP